MHYMWTPHKVWWRSAGRRWKWLDSCAQQIWRPQRRSVPSETPHWAPLQSVHHVYSWKKERWERWVTAHGEVQKAGLELSVRVSEALYTAVTNVRLTQQKDHNRCQERDMDLLLHSICPAAHWTFKDKTERWILSVVIFFLLWSIWFTIL